MATAASRARFSQSVVFLMRFTTYTSGTRGDVQPFIPLAQGLQRAGHRVRLAASSNFQDLIEQAGIDGGKTGDSYRDHPCQSSYPRKG